MKRLLILLLLFSLFAGCTSVSEPAMTEQPPMVSVTEDISMTTDPPSSGDTSTEDSPVITGSMPLLYAEQFAVDYLSDGSALITVGGSDRFLLLPEGVAVPSWLGDDTVVLQQPLRQIYNAASSAMDLFVQLDSLGQVRFTSTAYPSWSLVEVKDALDAEDLIYVGKYSAPDFELLMEEKCELAVESTMIYHSPDIKEQLESLDIPVLVERSSYEPHPLGRVEWVKLYGLLLGLEDEAETFFDEQIRKLDELTAIPTEELTVAYFHISTARTVVVRKPGDYISKMIEIAGGNYIFSELPGQDESSLSTMNMDLEAFYAGAKDADVLIYNSTIDGELDSVAQLLGKSELLADFKAVKEDNVWCSEHDLFQKSSAAARVIRELNRILSGDVGENEQLEFFHRLK